MSISKRHCLRDKMPEGRIATCDTKIDGTFRLRDPRLIPKITALRNLETSQEGRQSVTVLMTITQTKVTTW